MQYRSISDMNDALVKNLHRLPRDIDLVVGIPRSGLLAANLLSLAANIPLSDIDSYVAGRSYTTGVTKLAAERKARPTVLVLDDSIHGGTAMAEARAKIAASGIDADHLFVAVYGAEAVHPEADFVLEVVPQPRMFQWNFMHHKWLAQSCVDIDGVLCLDPTEAENDDGAAYLEFLTTARPLYSTKRRIGALVTSRLEKYRPQTEAWLAKRGISYDRLVMLDLPSKAERQRLMAHGQFKADVYRRSEAMLFIESENAQAIRIAELSGKPVLCLETHRLITPDLASVLSQVPKVRSVGEGKAMAKRVARSVLGPARYAALKKRLARR